MAAKGTLRKVGGIWTLRYYDPVKGKRTSKSLKTGDQKIARQRQTEFMSDLSERASGVKSARRWETAAEKEMERIEVDVSKSQADRAEYAFMNFRKWAGNIDLRRITRKKIEDFQRHRLQEVALDTVNKELSFILRLLKENGFTIARPAPKKGKKTIVRAFTAEEIKRFFAQPLTHHSRTLYAVALFTGSRPTELVPSAKSMHTALLKSEVFPEQNEVLIRTAKGHLGETVQPRRIGIPAEVMQLITNLKTKGKHVFPQSKNLARNFNYWLDKAEIAKVDALGRKLTMHSFRHTFATMMSRIGVPAIVLRDALGHRATHTLERYLSESQVAAPVLSLDINITGAESYPQKNVGKSEKVKKKKTA